MNQSVRVVNLMEELRTVPGSGSALAVAAAVVSLPVHGGASHVRVQVQGEPVRMTIDGVDPNPATGLGEVLLPGEVRILPRGDALHAKLIREDANSGAVYVTALTY